MSKATAIHKIAIASLLLTSAPAAACSIDIRPLRERVEQIRSDRELLRLRGTFHLLEVQGEPINDPERPGWLRNARILGTVVTEDGRRFETAHSAPNSLLFEELPCLEITYFLPTRDSRGIFYLSRTRPEGRHQLLHQDAPRRADRFRTRR